MNNQENQLYINDIKKALSNGNAVVMIGAGFSLNAYNGYHLKDWFSIGHEFKKAIEGDSAEKPTSPQEVMSLGEQYEALFGRTKLNNILKKMLPDTLVAPGELHKQLLELPWNDVFTTNYDTLLERAADNLIIADHKYFPVYNAEDLPQSRVVNTKRIIKLHGSFPSSEPFIFTTEDYRTYPQKFAPFINTVKQALLENTMCLIGFSGSDPNFLEWIGWIRDILNEHSLPIYLMLSSMPSEGEQKVLASRKITPVLYPYVSGKTDSYSDRVSAFLSQINPVNNKEKWADQMGEEINSQLQELRKEISQRSMDLDFKLENIDSKEWHIVIQFELKYLQMLKDAHPGWLITPNEFRNKLKYEHLGRLETFSNSYKYKELAVLELPLFFDNVLNRIYYYSYYLWTKDILLEVIEYSLLVKIVEKFLQDLELLIRLPNFDSYQNEYTLLTQSKGENEQHIINIIISLLGKMRRFGMKCEYDALILSIKTSKYYCKDIESEIIYQNILSELYLGDQTAAKLLLASWKIPQGQFLAQLRKANLLLEIGNSIESENLLHILIKDVRLLQRHQTTGLFLISVEAYALELISRINSINQYDFSGNKDEEKPIREQMFNDKSKILKDSEYNIQYEMLILTSRISAEEREDGLTKKAEAAYSLLMLCDHIGLGFKYHNFTYDLSSALQGAWYLQSLNIPIHVSLEMVHRTYNSKAIKHEDDVTAIYLQYWFNPFQLENVSKEYLSDWFLSLSQQIDKYFDKSYVRDANKFSYDVRLYTLFATSSVFVSDSYNSFKKIIDLFSITLEYTLFKRPVELESLRNSIYIFLDKTSIETMSKVVSHIIDLHDLYSSKLHNTHLKIYNVNLYRLSGRIHNLIDKTKCYAFMDEVQELVNKKMSLLVALSRKELINSREIEYLMLFCDLDWISIDYRENINKILWGNDNEFIVFHGFYDIATLYLAHGTHFETAIEKKMIEHNKKILNNISIKRDETSNTVITIGGDDTEVISELGESISSLGSYLCWCVKNKRKTMVNQRHIALMCEVVFRKLSRNKYINNMGFESISHELDKIVANYLILNFAKEKYVKIDSLLNELGQDREYFLHTNRLIDLYNVQGLDIDSWNIKIEEIAFQFIDLPWILTNKSPAGFNKRDYKEPTIAELIDMVYLWHEINVRNKVHYSIDTLIDVLLVQMSVTYNLEYLYDRCQILYHMMINAPSWFSSERLKGNIKKKMTRIHQNLEIKSAKDQFRFKHELHFISKIYVFLDKIEKNLVS